MTSAWTSPEGAAHTLARAPVLVGIVFFGFGFTALHLRNARALDKHCEVAALRVGFRIAEDQSRGRLRPIPGFSPRQPEADRLVASQLEIL